MEHEELDNKLDEWLDRASAGYGRAETRPGFESRIVANVNSRLEGRRWRLRWLPISATAVAVLVFSIWFIPGRFQDKSARNIALQNMEKKKPVPAQLLHNRPISEVKSNNEKSDSLRMRAGMRALSKPIGIESSIGPGLLSSPPSEQELLLIAYARSASRESAGETADEQMLQPLEVPETVVSPMEVPELKISLTNIAQLEIAVNLK